MTRALVSLVSNDSTSIGQTSIQMPQWIGGIAVIKGLLVFGKRHHIHSNLTVLRTLSARDAFVIGDNL